jgi:hypothetical protein
MQMGVQRLAWTVRMVHKFPDAFWPRAHASANVGIVDHLLLHGPHCPQTTVYTVVYMHTVLCKMGVGWLVWTVRMTHSQVGKC